MARANRIAVRSRGPGRLLHGFWLLVACGDVVGTPIDAVRGEVRQAPDAATPPTFDEPDASAAGDSDAGAMEGAVGNVGTTMSGDVPDSAYCDSVAIWPSEDAAAEQRMLEAVLARRVAADFECNSGQPLGPLLPSPELRCSARIHSVDMVARDFVNIASPDGTMPTDRMTQAGLRPDRWGEIVQRGEDPDETLARIVQDNPWGCSVLGDARVERIGIGYHGGRWTLDLATPF